MVMQRNAFIVFGAVFFMEIVFLERLIVVQYIMYSSVST